MNGLEYNSQLPKIKINEYGRNFQLFVDFILKQTDKTKRTQLAEALVVSVLQTNPHLKEVENGNQIVWNFLHYVSDYQLDVDSPYPVNIEQSASLMPNRMDYPQVSIKYRYYGKNLQAMIKNAVKMPEGNQKQLYLDLLGSFMKNSGKNWNDDFISDKQIVEHLRVLSENEIDLTTDEINADMDLKHRNIQSNKNNFKKGKKRNHKFNKNRRR